MPTGPDPSTEDRLHLAPDLTHRRVGEQLFAVSPEGRMVVLDNATAITLWDVLASGGARGVTRGELAGALVTLYEVELTQAETDADGFVQTLEQEGVLSRTSAGPELR